MNPETQNILQHASYADDIRQRIKNNLPQINEWFTKHPHLRDIWVDMIVHRDDIFRLYEWQQQHEEDIEAALHLHAIYNSIMMAEFTRDGGDIDWKTVTQYLLRAQKYLVTFKNALKTINP